MGAALGTLDEEEASVPEARELVAQVLLERRRERSAEDVPIPETPVLDEQPAIDAARGRCQRLARPETSAQRDRFTLTATGGRVPACKGPQIWSRVVAFLQRRRRSPGRC